MSLLRATLVSIALISLFPTRSAAGETELMPRPTDHTSMWWREGFPGIIPGARWHRCIRTGHFGFVLDTETLAIPHLGALHTGTENREIFSLPSAQLQLTVSVGGKTYHCTQGGEWTRFTGPRLVESGRFFQRGDITNLNFKADDGSILNSEFRLETAAWPDRLSFVLAGRPGVKPISAGEDAFGRVGGGFGLDGNNAFTIPAAPALATPAFTVEFWAFIPNDYQAGTLPPWLFCRGRNELTNGNIGIMLSRGATPEVRLNLGGGKENAYTLRPEARNSIRRNTWNHLAVSYDNETLTLYSNGHFIAEKMIGKSREPSPDTITFGRRGDSSGDGYRFRGVIDEVRYYDRALKLEELRRHFHRPEAPHPELKPLEEWAFSQMSKASVKQLREQWNDTSMKIELTRESATLSSEWQLPEQESWSEESRSVSLTINPMEFSKGDRESIVTVTAKEATTGKSRPVTYEPDIGWHRVNLDGIKPIIPQGATMPSNDAIERVALQLTNDSEDDQIARLNFEKTSGGIHQRIGAPITGISAVLRDRDGNPVGIPVQLSKNWHNEPEGGVYAGQWFHGISQIRIPAQSQIELELVLVYGHWGGLPAASHAQLSLIGWGGNQRWDQSALGAWGESICYDPEQAQANCSITDVRPLMVTSKNNREWSWTNNFGGGDFFRLFAPFGKRIPHSAMQARYHRYGPCLTEVTYSGSAGDSLSLSNTVTASRTDDIVRGTYRIRLDVKKPVDFSRFVIFQMGADTYNDTAEKEFAFGNSNGLQENWNAQWGDNTYRTDPKECTGQFPWVSLHDAIRHDNEETGALANRGMVIRKWHARLGGKEASPWVAERGLTIHTRQSSTLDLVPPPGVARLEAGDFVEATIEHLLIPQVPGDYYGPNGNLRKALAEHPNSWQTVHREAKGNARSIEVKKGILAHRYPDIEIETKKDAAEFSLEGGIGYVPITFSRLSQPAGYSLIVDGKAFDQSVHGNDFWQTDWDAESKTWSQTFNVPVTDNKPRQITFQPIGQ